MELPSLVRIRRRLVRGLLLVLPLIVTVWWLRLLVTLVNENVTPFVARLFRYLGAEDVHLWLEKIGFPVIGVLITILAIYLLGLAVGNRATRRMLVWVESVILRVPFVKGIYGSARQLIDAFSAGGERTFSKVVLVEYPRRGLWTVGFVTTEAEHLLGPPAKTDPTQVIPVFLPTTPNPTSGWLAFVPSGDLVVLDMTIEAGIKLVVSGGIVHPGNLGDIVRPWDGAAAE